MTYAVALALLRFATSLMSVLAILATLFVAVATPPGDGKMVRNFHHHRAAFEELARLVKDNRNLIWLSQTEAESFHALDATSVAHVRGLLHRVAAIGVRQDGASGAFTIVYERYGTVWSRDYVYREGRQGADARRPVASDPGATAPLRPKRVMEQPIGGNWALRLEHFD